MTDFDRPSHDPTADTTVHQVADTPTTTDSSPAPIATPVATGPAAADATAAKKSRVRWVAAGLIVALVVGVSAIATLSLTGASADATVLGYAPADSVAYGEARLDLPGDQGPMLAEFLSHFPGFADQAAIETKLDELLDQLVGEATDGEQSYTADIEPWFEGEIAFTMGPLPANVADPEAAAPDVRAMLLLSIKDAALATSWFDATLQESGVTTTAQDYAGTTLNVYSDPDMGGAEAAYGVIDGKVLVAGDLTSVKAAVDTGGTSGLSDDQGFAAALAAGEGDHMGFMYVDLRSLMDAALALGQEATEIPLSGELLELVPDWAGFQLRVEGDALVMDASTSHVDGLPGPDQNRPNTVADFAPPSTVVLGAANDYGATLDEVVALYANEPMLGDVMTQIEDALGIVGGLDAAIDWMGDTGYVVAQAGDTVEGGIISVPTNADDAEAFLTTIKSLVALGGGQAGIEVREEEYAGTTITIIDLGSAEDLLGMAGAMGGMPLEPGMTPGLPTGDIELSFAATDGVVVIGSGPNFVKAVLDAGAGDSLGDSSRYRDLVARAGSDHTGVTFVDIAAIRTLAEGFLTEATGVERAEYEESIKPFLEPLDALVATSVVGDPADQQHVLITVK
jgi:hypothetical protein